MDRLPFIVVTSFIILLDIYSNMALLSAFNALQGKLPELISVWLPGALISVIHGIIIYKILKFGDDELDETTVKHPVH